MKHRLKGLLALVLSLTMVFALATNAWAAVWIGNVDMGDGTTPTYYKNGDTGSATGSESDYNAMLWLDGGNLTLTLNDADIDDTYYVYGIEASGDLTINLIGDNTVWPAASGGAYGVSCNGKLTIKGSGRLTAVGVAQNYGFGICADSIEIKEGTVIAQGSTNAVYTNTTLSFGNTHKATASVYFDGSDPVAYAATNIGSYKYLEIEPIICTVTYDLNGRGTMTTATQTDIPAGGKITEPAPAPTEAGWTFGGWYKEAACSNAYDFSSAVHSSFTLYAKWTENSLPAQYTVKFNANGGSGTMNPVTVDAGDYTLPANGFTAPAGKEFIGWSVDPAGAERMRPGEQMQITKDTTLYAIWKSTGGNVGQVPGTPTPEPEVTAPKTFDSGVALHIGLTILAASGSAWLAKKKD